MAKLQKLTMIGVKTETTYNAFNAPGAGDFMYAMNVVPHILAEKLERDYTRNTLDTLQHVIGQVSQELSMDIPLHTSGGATLPAPIDACLRSAGFNFSGGVYTPMSRSGSIDSLGAGHSCTIYTFTDGIKYALQGCMSNAKFTFQAGKIPMMHCDFKGTYVSATDSNMPSGSIQPTLEAKVQNAALVMQGYTPIASKLEIDCGNSVDLLDDVSSVQGVFGFQIGARNPVGSFDPLATTVAVHDFLGKLVSGAMAAGSIVLTDSSTHTITFALAGVQYNDVIQAARANELAFQIPVSFRTTDPQTDQWLTITVA